MNTARLPTENQRRLDADFEAIFGSPVQPPRPVPLSHDEVLELEAEQAQVRG